MTLPLLSPLPVLHMSKLHFEFAPLPQCSSPRFSLSLSLGTTDRISHETSSYIHLDFFLVSQPGSKLVLLTEGSGTAIERCAYLRCIQCHLQIYSSSLSQCFVSFLGVSSKGLLWQWVAIQPGGFSKNIISETLPQTG